MTLCITDFATTQFDKSQADRDELGEAILADAILSGEYKRAFNKRVAENLRLDDLDEFIADNGLFTIPPSYGNFYHNFRHSIYRALAEGDEQRCGQIMLEIFKPIIDEKRNETEQEFDENPWLIEEVLNAS